MGNRLLSISLAAYHSKDAMLASLDNAMLASLDTAMLASLDTAILASLLFTETQALRLCGDKYKIL